MFYESISYENGLQVKQLELSNYYLDYYDASSQTLVITFEPWMADASFFLNRNREAWGLNFLAKESFSVVGVKSKIPNWFRDEELHTFFRSNELKIFCKNFQKIVLYGGSMGGYGALAFADAFEDPIVIAMAPQSTLKNEIVPWETRFKLGRKQDWSGDFIDGYEGTKNAKIAYTFYDPFNLDRKHIDRLKQENIVKIPISFAGHKIPAFLLKTGLLKKVVLDCIHEQFDRKNFCVNIKEQRKELPSYFNALARKTKSKKIKKFCVERNLKLTSHETTNNDFIETLEIAMKNAIDDNDKLQAYVIAAALKSIPQRPKFIGIFLMITKYYIKESRIDLARRYLNSLDPAVIIKVSTKNLFQIKQLSKQVKSKLHAELI